jgi:hypothetical protein
MPILILLGVLIVLLAIWFAIKMKKSYRYDQIIRDITEPVDVTPKTSNNVIRDISVAEKVLKATAETGEVDAEKLQKESAKIRDYLGEEKKK